MVANDSWLQSVNYITKKILWFFTVVLFYFTCREKERICGPDGFLDSKRYQRSYKISRKPKESDRSNQHISVVDLRQSQHQHSKEYDKRMKVIEVSKDEILYVEILQQLLSFFKLPTASKGWGKVMFSVCPHRVGRGYPGQVQTKGGTQR